MSTEQALGIASDLDGLSPAELAEKQQIADEEPDIPQSGKQRISDNGRILVSKKAWMIRIITIAAVILIMCYNVFWGWSTGDPLVIYSVVAPVHTLIIFIVGWFFFRNRAKGQVPENMASVIIPVYNQEKLIGKVIQAIFKSSYSNIEVIAVNDGSKDNTGLVLESLARKYPKLKVVHQDNGGKRVAVAAGFRFRPSLRD